MSLIIKLRGGRAASAFRLDKLNSRLATSHGSVQIRSRRILAFRRNERALDARETMYCSAWSSTASPRRRRGPHAAQRAAFGHHLALVSRPTDIRADAVSRQYAHRAGTAWIFSSEPRSTAINPGAHSRNRMTRRCSARSMR